VQIDFLPMLVLHELVDLFLLFEVWDSLRHQS
jgi:hypothetical protein